MEHFAGDSHPLSRWMLPNLFPWTFDPNQPQAHRPSPVYLEVVYPQPGVAFASYPTPQPVYVSDPWAYQTASYAYPPPPPAHQQPHPYFSSSPQGFVPSARPYLPTPAPSSSVSGTSPRPVSSSSSRPSSSHHSTNPAQPLPTFQREDSPPTPLQLADLERLKHIQPGMSYEAQYNEAIRDLGGMKVDWLKAAIKKINAQMGTYLKVTGRKDELHTRLRETVTSLYHSPDKTRFVQAKGIIAQVRVAINPNAIYSPAAPNYAASTSTAASGSANGYSYGAAGGYGAGASSSGAGAGSANRAPYNSSLGRIGGVGNQLPAPRFGGYNAATGASGSGGAGGAGGSGGAGAAGWQNQRLEEVPIKFRPSPFYRVEKSLAAVVTCPKAAQGDRKVAACNLSLTEAQRTLLSKARESKSNPQYQVRIYCTSDQFFSGGRPLANQFPAPIEFPPSAEIKLNGAVVAANVKGIKKQPGTAPPVNLSATKGPMVNVGAATTNRVEMAYVSTEKVYYLVCYLVEYTPIPTIVNRVKAGKTRSKEEVIQNIVDMNADDEIEATALGVSLRDPLSFARMDVPIRSVHCGHISCFDAETWFEINEQTPTWACPICSRTLKVEDMIVDGYLQNILKICNDDVDEVRVEPDGTWRSDDDKHGTAKPRTAPTSTANTSSRNTPLGRDDKGKGRATPPDDGPHVDGRAGGSAANGSESVLLLDSDDDDEDDQPLAKRPRLNGGFSGAATPLSSAEGSVQPSNGAAKKGEVLDLTLSSDEDDEPVRPPPQRPGAAMARVSSTGSERKGTPLQQAAGAAAAGAGGGGGGAPAQQHQAPAGSAVANVQADIDAMNRRMEAQWGKDWRETFGYD
ncbi:hypothetical protein JCM6882_003911 [Rhodosporidiobolus microsporus]